MTNKYVASFNHLYTQLQDTDLFRKMEQTVEASPWHREANVRVHTDMVVSEYLRLVGEIKSDAEWDHGDYNGAVACAFHDVGKPSSQIEKWSEERGTYRAYHGHERVSARLAEDYLMKHAVAHPVEVAAIVWMIEHHMPWSITDKVKLSHIRATAEMHGLKNYTTALLADQFGRIADDQEAKNKRAVEWTDALLNDVEPWKYTQRRNGKLALIPIAPSGSGKSTSMRTLQQELNGDVAVFSLDQLRHEFYDTDDYRVAFEKSTQDEGFEARANAVFNQLATQNAPTVYIDNTNLTVRRRRPYIDVLRRNGYEVRALLFPVDIDTLVERQTTRPDKEVPKEAVIRQYMSLQQPMLGEFDTIHISSANDKYKLW